MDALLNEITGRNLANEKLLEIVLLLATPALLQEALQRFEAAAEQTECAFPVEQFVQANAFRDRAGSLLLTLRVGSRAAPCTGDAG